MLPRLGNGKGRVFGIIRSPEGCRCQRGNPPNIAGSQKNVVCGRDSRLISNIGSNGLNLRSNGKRWQSRPRRHAHHLRTKTRAPCFWRCRAGNLPCSLGFQNSWQAPAMPFPYRLGLPAGHHRQQSAHALDIGERVPWRLQCADLVAGARVFSLLWAGNVQTHHQRYKPLANQPGTNLSIAALGRVSQHPRRRLHLPDGAMARAAAPTSALAI